MKKIPQEKFLQEMGLFISILLFVVTRNINRGYLGFESWNWIRLSRAWYRNLLTTYIGMPSPGFFSTDYFSVIPWFFLFLTGYFLFGVCKKYGCLQWKILQKRIPFLDYPGKHSLMVYLLHQPIIFLLQELMRGAGII